jgi:hypothetical protein
MTDSAARHKIFADAADCLRSLSRYQTTEAQDLGPKMLDLANKLEAATGAGLRLKFSSSDRALLMETLSALAPLIGHAGRASVGPHEIMERKQCAANLESVVALIGAPPA